jgi:hypothetical protein
MSEATIAVPLSGEEVVESIIERVRTMLYNDCHLNPALAYQAFEAEIHIRLKLCDAQSSGETTEFADKMSGGDRKILEAEAFSRMEQRPPNAVRQEASLGIPTLVEDSQGRKEVRHVKYPKSKE